jgi:PAS domain S-box-containing protein
MAAAVDGPGESRAKDSDRALAVMRLASSVAASLTGAVGCVVLTGWWLGIAILRSGAPGAETVKPNTAVGLVLSCAAFWLLRRPGRRPWVPVVGRTLAATLVVLAAASVAQSVLAVDLYIDRIVVGEAGATARAARMAPNTAAGLVLVGLALLLLHTRVGRWWPTHGLALAAGALGFVALVGYTTDVPSLYGPGQFTLMAVPTAVSLVLLGLGLLLLRPDRGALRLLVSQGPGGVLARRVLPAAVVLPVVLAYLRWQGEAHRLYQTQVGVFLFTAAVIVLFTVAVWLAARYLDRADRAAKRAARTARVNEQRAEAEQRQAREDIDHFFNLSLDLLCIAGMDGYFRRLNPAWEVALGYRENELLTQPFASFIHPDDLAATHAEVARLSAGARTVSFENRYRCADGTYRWLLWNTVPLPERGLLYAVARDITERKHTEDTSARLAAVVDASVDTIVGLGMDATITSWNRGAERMLGYPAEEIIGRSLAVLAPPDRPYRPDLLARVAGGEAVEHYEMTPMRKDGKVIDVSLTISPVHGPDGSVVGASLIARDITETRRVAETLRAQQAQTSSIIATASDAFVSMDAAGLITEWNHAAEELFGWSRPEVIGRVLAETIIPTQHRGAHTAGLRRVLAGGDPHVLDQRIEITALHRDGREIPIELAVWRLTTGTTDHFSAFIRDNSQRQQIEQDLANARDAALEASRLKSEFLATMSHEIRTPMNGVIGLTGLLLDSRLDDTQRRYADGIRSSGKVLLSVINDILDFSKIEAGKLVIDDAAVNLGALVDEVTELVADTARKKGLELVGYCDPALPTQVRGDPVRLRQILLNLATNAVKFTEHGEVLIQVRPGRSAPDAGAGASATGPVEVRFEVIDSGIGIAAEDRDRLFEAFSQVEASTTRRHGGTGLGLAICRELATAMDGRIGVDSRVGGGSTFWCVIPLQPAAAGQPPAPEVHASLDGLRALVVDDNDTNRLILSHQLQNWSVRCTAVESGQLALDELWDASSRGQAYDLVLLDMRMPDMDGLEVATRIRAHLGIPPVPLILLTSDGLVPADVVRDAGIAACLMKPVYQSQLHDCLVRVVAGVAELDTATLTGTAAPPTDPATPRGHLLLVEDNEVNQLVALGLLTGLGYTADVAGNGLDALELAGRNTYRAVLMDCQMPHMDGYQTTGELRRREHTTAGTPRTPIIAMTAAALEGDRERCLAAGMDDYISKPVRPNELAAVLTRWATAPPPASPSQDMPTEQGIKDRLAELRVSLPPVAGDLVSQVVTSFLNRAPTYLADLENTLARGDTAAFAAAAHSLNGAASNLGATAMADLCDALEMSVRGNDLDAAPALLSQLHAEHLQVRAILEDPAMA